MRAALIDVIDRLDEVNDSDRFDSMEIFAEGGSDAGPTARALVCSVRETASLQCPQDSFLSYVLTVQLARECIAVWSEWRGWLPTRADKFAAVLYYARNDAWLPVEACCPEDVRTAVLEILSRAILSIRVAGWNEDSDYCAVEADHIHNLPSLLRAYDREKLRYYLDAERKSYLHQRREMAQAAAEAYGQYWEQLEEFLRNDAV